MEHDESNVSAPRQSRWWVAVFVVLLIGIALAWRVNTAPSVTTATFSRVKIGMTRAEVYTLLGESQHETATVGAVNTSGSLTINFGSRNELLKQGYRDYLYEAWFSPELTVNIAFDRDGRVACKYSTGGQRRTLMAMLWPKKRAVLPPLPDNGN